MNKSIQFVGGLLLSVGLLVACGDDTSDSPGGGNTGGGGSDTGAGGTGAGDVGGGGADGGGGSGPIRPEKGAGIDRMGRPAINTALNGAFIQFDPDSGAPQASDDAQRLAEQDEYNESTQPGDWAADYTEVFAANLAILDVLEAGLTGTQPGICQNPVTGCADANTVGSAACYGTVASVLTNDRLFVFADGEGCSAAPFDNGGVATDVGGYLSVEAAALLDVLDLTGCGGRRPIDDVIETTYSVVALGALAGFDDGITADDVPGTDTFRETFPYIGEPL